MMDVDNALPVRTIDRDEALQQTVVREHGPIHRLPPVPVGARVTHESLRYGPRDAAWDVPFVDREYVFTDEMIARGRELVRGFLQPAVQPMPVPRINYRLDPALQGLPPGTYNVSVGGDVKEIADAGLLEISLVPAGVMIDEMVKFPDWQWDYLRKAARFLQDGETVALPERVAAVWVKPVVARYDSDDIAERIAYARGLYLAGRTPDEVARWCPGLTWEQVMAACRA